MTKKRWVLNPLTPAQKAVAAVAAADEPHAAQDTKQQVRP